ncbi:class I SAM-dependent methyltransferase [Halothiobacillus sp. DCM-1]|uniref:class I SAM-dependent methyltransferase n=1 Tax=Halothiobacillus sp. DCM-1 TaxID=3112558 RepID=UPI00324CBC15
MAVLQHWTPVSTRRTDWYQTPVGRLIGKELADLITRLADDAFGYQALTIGAVLPEPPALRIRQHSQLAATRAELAPWVGARVQVEFEALPIASESVDLLIALHVLESHRDPHDIMRELDRILRPEGRMLIVGINPLSLWHLASRLRPESALAGSHHAPWRVVDWLKLLGYAIHGVHHWGGVCPTSRPGVYEKTAAWRRVSGRGLGIMHGFYVIDAVRRVSTPTTLRPAFALPSLLSRPAPVTPGAASTVPLLPSPSNRGSKTVEGLGREESTV